MSDGWVDIPVLEVLRESEKALKVLLQSGEELWLPKSQLAEPDAYGEGDREVTLQVTRWLAETKELI
jgi:hypothetical protein